MLINLVFGGAFNVHSGSPRSRGWEPLHYIILISKNFSYNSLLPSTQQENLGSNEMLLYVAIEPEALEEAIEAGQPPVATLRKKHSVGSGPVQGTMAPAPRIAYSYQVNTKYAKMKF